MSENIFDKRNDFIFFNEDLDRAELTPQSRSFEAVKALDRRDRNKGKPFLNKCVNMIFFLHHKDSPISHLSVQMKTLEISNINDDFKSFDFSNKYYKKLEELFIKTHYSRVENRYLSFIDDLDSIRDSLVEMPTKVRKKVVKSIDVEGEPKTIEGYIEYDNQLDKVKAVKALLDLDKLEKVLKVRIEEEYKSKTSKGRRLFDQ